MRTLTMEAVTVANLPQVMRDKIRGMFLGGAIGDSLFMPVETWSAERIKTTYGRLATYVRPDGHKWFNGRDAGTWTDDTQLALPVAESLISKDGIDLNDMAVRHVKSLQEEGDLGFGDSTKKAIERLAAGIHWSRSGRSDNPHNGTGNGVAMKIASIEAFRASLFWDTLSAEARSAFIANLRRLTLMTHYKPVAVESALAHVFAIDFCIRHSPLKEFSTKDFMIRVAEMSDFFNINQNDRFESELPARLKMLAEIDLTSLTAESIIKMFGGGTCYVLNSLPFSYAFFIRNPHSIETLYDVGNAGGDTDTNASIVGGLLGALNGVSIFPQHLIDGLWQKERIVDIADRFYVKFYREGLES